MSAEMKRKLAVIAVGGNALIREKGKESLPDQYMAACKNIRQGLLDLIYVWVKTNLYVGRVVCQYDCFTVCVTFLGYNLEVEGGHFT